MVMTSINRQNYEVISDTVGFSFKSVLVIFFLAAAILFFREDITITSLVNLIGGWKVVDWTYLITTSFIIYSFLTVTNKK